MSDSHSHPSHLEPAAWRIPEITPEDEARFARVTDTGIADPVRGIIEHPGRVFPQEACVLAVHWHPEFVPLDWIRTRVANMFPGARERLVIPTQHNHILCMDGYCGVEIDCHSKEFGLKVQLLVHFSENRLPHAETFKAMAEHTFRYRASQLDDFLFALHSPQKWEMRARAADEAAPLNEDEMDFLVFWAEKLHRLLEKNRHACDPLMIRNKLVLDWFDSLRDRWAPSLLHRIAAVLRAVKMQVKREFSPEYFFLTQEVIEEARGFGAGIIVPHPEQFWPILLADYDIDGYEVWNPQSQAYTNFLMQAVQNINRTGRRRSRPLLTLMGDDCHMSEKCKPVELQDPEKAAREVGWQPAWEDMAIKKTLAMYNIRKSAIISEYKQRLE